MTSCPSARVRIFVLILVACGQLVEAQQKRLTLDAIYSAELREDFSGLSAADITWIDEGTFVLERNGGREWKKVEAATGRATHLVDPARFEEALAALHGIPRTEAA